MSSPYPLAELTTSNLRFLLEYLAADPPQTGTPQNSAPAVASSGAADLPNGVDETLRERTSEKGESSQ